MATPRNTRIRVTDTAKRGEVIQIRAIIQHPMENGFNFDSQGTAIPVHIVHTFVCLYNQVEVFRVELEPGISANPYLSFFTVATESGTLEFIWDDDDGTTYRVSKHIEVT